MLAAFDDLQALVEDLRVLLFNLPRKPAISSLRNATTIS